MVTGAETGMNPRSARRAGRRFVRTFAGTIAVLVLLVGGLAAANLTQGPGLAASDINLDGSVTRNGSKLVLTADQPLAEGTAQRVTVTPQTDASSTVSGNTLTIEFPGILRYNTEYTVTVDGVTGLYNNAVSTLKHSFTTPDSRIYALQRDARLEGDGAKRPDTVRRTSLQGRGDGEIVLSAPRIQEYVALDAHLAAVTLGTDNLAALEVVSFSGGEPAQITLPTAGTVTNLLASPTKNLIAYTFTSAPDVEGRQFENTPFTYDLTDPSGLPREVTGFDGLPMSVMDLEFVPGTTSLVLQEYGQSLFLVQAIGEPMLTPLGTHAELRGFIPGTRDLVVADLTQGATLDLDDGTLTALDLAVNDLSETAYPGKLLMIDGKGRHAQLFLQPTSEGGDTQGSDLTSTIAVTDAAGSDTTFSPATATSRVRDFCVSPNGQYLAVEIIAAEGAADDYPVVPAFSSMTTVFVDLAAGTSARSVSGFQPDWCG